MTRHDHAEHTFTSVPESVAAARTFISRTLQEWHVTSHADDILLCASELASNAVKYGSSTEGGRAVFQVRLDADDTHLRVEVEDGDPLTVPRMNRAAEGETGGRGMAIVASLASAWGFESHAAAGKAVWSEFVTSAA
ncbi:ATP-binding protein [Streptomyces lavendulae]|uniref:ATP-binding protein n=1 Tax=Streptomyces lavendulae TaxID=1914 RepID=UPI00368D8501